jgi:hypothetical protein
LPKTFLTNDGEHKQRAKSCQTIRWRPNFVVVSALCADLVDPQARRYTILGHHQRYGGGFA